MSGARLKWEQTGFRYVDKPTGMVLRAGLAQPRGKLKWWWDVVDSAGARMAGGFAENPSKAKGNAHKALEAVKSVTAKAPLPVRCEAVPTPEPWRVQKATARAGVKCR